MAFRILNCLSTHTTGINIASFQNLAGFEERKGPKGSSAAGEYHGGALSFAASLLVRLPLPFQMLGKQPVKRAKKKNIFAGGYGTTSFL